MVLGQGGPLLAMLTCLATVVVAGTTGAAVASLAGHSYIEKISPTRGLTCTHPGAFRQAPSPKLTRKRHFLSADADLDCQKNPFTPKI